MHVPLFAAKAARTPDHAPLTRSRPFRTALYLLAAAGQTALFYGVYRHAGAWQTDLDVYRRGISEIFAGAPLYRNDIDFTYPPFGALLLAPLSAPGRTLCALLVIFVSIGLLHAAVARLLAFAAWPAPGARPWAVVGIGGVLVWLFPGRTSLLLGQVTFLILAVTSWDLTREDTSRAKGIGIGLMAGLKLVPAVYGAYYLCTGRLRPAAVSAGTFLGTAAVGAAVLPGDSYDYWTRFVFDSARIGDPEKVDSETIKSLLVRSVHGTRGTAVPWLVLTVLAVAGCLYLARKCWERDEELLAVSVCATLTLLVLPIAWTFYWTWVLAPLSVRLAQLAAAERSRQAMVSLLVLVAVFVPDTVTALRTDEAGVELALNTGQQVLAATHALAAAFVLALAARLIRRRPAMAEAAPHAAP